MHIGAQNTKPQQTHRHAVSFRLECNFEDIDISRFQLWLLSLIFYFLFFLLPSFNTWRFSERKKQNKECNICSLAFAPTDKKIQFYLILLVKNYKWVCAWCPLFQFVSILSFFFLLRSSSLCASNYAIATIFVKLLLVRCVSVVRDSPQNDCLKASDSFIFVFALI